MQRKTIRIIFLQLFIFCVFSNLIFSNEIEQEKFSRLQMIDALNLNNNELNTLHEEYAQSLLDVKNAKAGCGPSIDLTVSGTYMLNPPIDSIVLNVDDVLNSIQWPSGIQPTSNGQYITLYDGMENSLYSFQLELTQPVYTWGKLSTAIKLYQEVSNVKQIQINSKYKQLIAELNTRLASLYYLQEIQTHLLKEKEYSDRLIKIAEEAEANGLLLHQDVLEAKISAQQISIAQQNVQEQFSNVLLGIQKMIGNSSINNTNISFTPDEKSFLDYSNLDRTVLEQNALDKSQDTFQMLDSLKLISEYSTKIANASVYWKPDFAIKMSLGYGGSRFPFLEQDWYRQNDYTTNFTLALKTTVWDGGKKLNEIKRSESKEELANINISDTTLTIKQKLHEQFNTIDLNKTKIEYQKLKIETQLSKIAQQQQLFNSGYGSEKDLLQAQIEKLNFEIELLQNKLSLAGACYTAAYLTGTDLFINP